MKIYVYKSFLLGYKQIKLQCWSRQLVANKHRKIVKIIVQIFYLAYDNFFFN